MDTDEVAGRKPGPTMSESRYPELAGQVAVITGAAKGLGRGIAERLASEGMRLVAADIDGGSLERASEELTSIGAEVVPVRGDMGDTADITRLFDMALESFGTVDLLVNNAANLKRKRFLDEHARLLEKQMAVNLLGPYRCSQRAAAIMRDQGGGSIVSISSVGAMRAHHRGFPYDVTKGAINTMTLAMAVDLAEYGIRVNAIGPGAMRTYRVDPESESYRARDRRIPLGRHGDVADIAAAVAFLASPEASYITGQIIYVDGGISAQLSPAGEGG